MPRFIAIVLLLIPSLFSQAPPKPDDLCSIEGRVINETTGSPIAKAIVVLTPAVPVLPTTPAAGSPQPIPHAVQTDAAGRYLAPDLLPGSYRIAARKAGFMTSDYGSKEPRDPNTTPAAAVAAPMEITAGRHATAIDFKLRPYGAIAGRILDTDGDPMWHAQVGVYRWAYSNTGVRGLRRFMDGDTDDTGDYRIFQLPPGQYAICAYGPGQPNGEDRSARPSNESYVTTCFPGADLAEAASAIEVKAGQTVPAVNFKMVKRRSATVRGLLTTPTPGLQRGAVRLFSLSNSLVGTRYPSVGPKGDFEISGVPAGEYRLVAMANGQTAEESVSVSDQPVDTSVTLGSGVTLNGAMQVDGLTKPTTPTTIYIDDPEIGIFWGGARLDGEGNFVLGPLFRWRLHLRFNLPAGIYVKSAVMGDHDVLQDGLDLRNGTNESLRVLLGSDVATIAGTVRNEKDEAAPGATVLAVPWESSRRKRYDEYKIARSDDSGVFHFRNLPPGDYRLFAWTSVENMAWLSEDFMRPIEGQGVALTASGNGSYTTDLKVIPQEVRR